MRLQRRKAGFFSYQCFDSTESARLTAVDNKPKNNCHDISMFILLSNSEYNQTFYKNLYDDNKTKPTIQCRKLDNESKLKKCMNIV